MYVKFSKNNRSNICMGLQSVSNILAVIAVVAVVMNIFTLIWKFPSPAYLGLNTLINFSVINFVVLERGFGDSPYTIIFSVIAYLGLFAHIYFWIKFMVWRKK